MSNTPVVQIENLMKQFPVGGGYFTALKEINLQFETGEFSGLVGPSGSGKTTLLNQIGGLDSPSEGDVNVLSMDLVGATHNERAALRKEKMGFIFQSYNLLPVYTVFENVELPLILNKVDSKVRKELVEQAVEWVGLTDKLGSRPSQLSGGECQRTAIARAIVHKPRLVLADEPTANLDAKNSHQIMKILVNLNQELDTSFIFATHDEKIMEYLKRIIHLDDGQVTEDELIAQPKMS
ncbi:lipoprotein-releasing system ATP-binding protein LolD [Candidatus Woesearchaeota archaeon]|jgi:putative ABC transport system ATP-binding protein|nr:lipoprotein-releasing system ATP-binding protein LolD [Candidatus Woesearchaeota archaeon]|tara:strand:- start:132 stop:842 length:711 start_codon:yes stop_codon:yes gene_type:complete